MAMDARELAELMYDRMLAVNPPETPVPAELKEIAIAYFETASAGPIIDYLKDNMDVLPGTFANSAGNVIGVGKVV